MSETIAPARVELVEFQCEQCHSANLVQNGAMLMSMPPQWPHTCPSCGVTKVLPKSYPHSRIVAANDYTKQPPAANDDAAQSPTTPA